jgi:hypothetical protein
MDKIPGGYILLAKKMIESEIMDKPPLYLKLWVWMLTQAKFRPEKGLERGQFKTSIKEMQAAMAHHVGARKVVPTVKQIRSIYESLSKGNAVGISKGTGGMIVTVLKYEEYQDPKNYERHSEGHAEKSPKGTPSLYRKNKRISRGKFALDFFTPEINGWDKSFVEKAVDGFISTRKTKEISLGILSAEFEYWKQFSDRVVNQSLKAYTEKRYWEKDKGEKYLRGIMRGKHKAEEKTNSRSLFQRGF